MTVDINWLAVALATLSSMAVGSIWYSKLLFVKPWLTLAKLDEKKMAEQAAKTMPRTMAIALVMSFLAAFVIAHVAALSKSFYDIGTLEAGLTTAFWLWAGISVTTVVVHDIFEQRPAKLTLITIGNQFFTLLAMGLIIGLFGGF